MSQSADKYQGKNIALWGSGIFPDQNGNKGIPSFAEMLTSLSRTNSITLYSHTPIQRRAIPDGIKLRTVYWSDRRMRIFALIIIFLFDHMRKRFDILQSHSSHPDPLICSYIGRFLKIPVIVGYNAGEFVALHDIGFGDFLNEKKKWAILKTVRNATVVTCVSRFQAEGMKLVVDDKKIRLIYRGVDTSLFSFKRKLLTYPIHIAHVGYLHPVKDQITLLNTFSLLRKKIDCHLHIAGADLWNGYIHQLAKEKGMLDHVTFYGQISHREVSELLSRCHILLHTPRYEAIGVSVLEAMSCGLLVGGTRVGLMSDLDEKCCVTADVAQPEELAMEILKVLENPERFLNITQNAYEWVKRHTMEQAVLEYQKLYDECSHD